MGEFTSGIDVEGLVPGEAVETDVEGVTADSKVKYGKEEFPAFTVTKDEFFNNMQQDRKRLRFKTDSPPQKYMQGTKYNKPFFLLYKDDDGRVYTRKVK